MTKEKKSVDIGKIDENMKIQTVNPNAITWHDPKQPPFQISGFAWFEQEREYIRLPKNPKWPVREPVAYLATNTAGGQIRFRTDATKLAVRVKLKGLANMNHMPATGQCGFDCYIGEPGNQKFVNATRYDHTKDEYDITLFERDNNDLVTITLNFPLYQGVEEVYVGLNQNALVEPPPKYDSDKKLIFYGTSILQGGCASRPGMAYTNIMSRHINLEFINLGFSGNGKGDESLARLISEIENPGLLVLDYEPNCTTEMYKETLPRFIEIYRQTHPTVPILVISKFPYAGEVVNRGLYEERMERLVFQKQLIEELRANGEQNIHFYEGTHLLGEDGHEKTVDGVHPTDIGFMEIAQKLIPVVKELISN